MTKKNKDFIFDLLLKKLILEVKQKNDEKELLITAIKDFNNSYFKGMDRLTNFMMIDDIIGGKLK